MKFFHQRSNRHFLAIVICFSLLIFFTITHLKVSAADEISEAGLTELFNTILYKVKDDYVDDFSSEKLWFGAIRGMLHALGDAHTRFMTPAELEELNSDTKGKFGGLGIEVTYSDGKIIVISPMEGTPAMRAGIKPGDVIIEIDKKSTNGLNLEDALKLLRGDVGASVTLTIAREGEEEPLYFDLVREIINLKIVEEHHFEKENIGYIKLKQFSQNSVEEVEESLKRMKKKKVKGLIFDLRLNPGGLLEASQKISNFFIKEGVIVSTRGRKKQWDKIFVADPKGVVYGEGPLVILVNEGSASASEIVTGAVKDHKRGKVIGTKTFGKGSVQSVIPLRYNTAIALTIQKYYTPSGVSIHKKGISPDLEVKALEFTVSDRRHYREIIEKKIIEEFIKTNKVFNETTLKSFRDMLKKRGLDLSDYASSISLKEKLDKNFANRKIDLEYDVQLKSALQELTAK